MADQSQNLNSRERFITAKNFLNTDSSGLQHHDHQEGSAPPMGLLTMKELTQRRNRSSLMSRKSSMKASQKDDSQASKNAVDRVSAQRHESLTTAKNDKRQERAEVPQNSVRVSTRRAASRASELSPPSSQTQHPKPEYINPYEDAITNPAQYPAQNAPSHYTTPELRSLASTHPSTQQLPSGDHPRPSGPSTPSWFARALPTLLANPPASFEPRAFSDEANALPLGALQASFAPLLRLVREATLRNGAAERRVAHCVWVLEGTREGLRARYGWRAYELRSWVLKWGGSGCEADGRGDGAGVGEDAASRVRAMEEVALRAELVTGLEVLGDLLDRARAYESWAWAFEQRHGAVAMGHVKGDDTKKYQSKGLGSGEGKAERMSLEEALEKTGPGMI